MDLNINLNRRSEKMKYRRTKSMFFVLLGFLAVALIIPAMAFPVIEPTVKVTPGTEFPLEVANDTWVNNGTLFMALHEMIGGEVQRLRQNLQYMKSINITNLELRMWNPGGNLFIMMYILDLLRDAKLGGVQLSTVGMEIIMSAAVPIFMLGETRTINGLGHIMMHPIQWGGYGSPPQNVLDMENRWNVVYADVVAENSKMEFQDVMDILSNEDKTSGTWFNAGEALDLELITSIGIVNN